jgi:hypothetical protein
MGVDRDASIIAKAETRVAAAGLGNVTFVQSDIGEFESSAPFDAVVGANMDMELTLYRTFQEAGLTPPQMRVEVPIGEVPGAARWLYDILCSVRPQMQRHGVSCDAVGDFDTLAERLQAEATAAKTFGAYQCLVGAWSRRPVDATRG